MKRVPIIRVILRGTSPKEFSSSKVVIGRSGKSDFCIESTDVSRRHLEISCEHGVLWVMDLGSRNGTFIDEKKLPPQKKIKCSNIQPLRLGKGVHLSIALATTAIQEGAVPASASPISSDLKRKTGKASEPPADTLQGKPSEMPNGSEDSEGSLSLLFKTDGEIIKPGQQGDSVVSGQAELDSSAPQKALGLIDEGAEPARLNESLSPLASVHSTGSAESESSDEEPANGHTVVTPLIRKIRLLQEEIVLLQKEYDAARKMRDNERETAQREGDAEREKLRKERDAEREAAKRERDAEHAAMTKERDTLRAMLKKERDAMTQEFEQWKETANLERRKGQMELESARQKLEYEKALLQLTMQQFQSKREMAKREISMKTEVELEELKRKTEIQKSSLQLSIQQLQTSTELAKRELSMVETARTKVHDELELLRKQAQSLTESNLAAQSRLTAFNAILNRFRPPMKQQ